MTPAILYLIGAAVCVLGVLLFTALAIRYRNEDWAFFLVIAAFVCGGGAATSFNESVTAAKVENGRNVPVDVQPGQR